MPAIEVMVTDVKDTKVVQRESCVVNLSRIARGFSFTLSRSSRRLKSKLKVKFEGVLGSHALPVNTQRFRQFSVAPISSYEALILETRGFEMLGSAESLCFFKEFQKASHTPLQFSLPTRSSQHRKSTYKYSGVYHFIRFSSYLR